MRSMAIMNTKMSKYLSRKIKFITVFAMTAVVFIHSYNFSDSFLSPDTRIAEGFNGAAMFEYFFSNSLLRFAVPMFFALSGFLFFFNYQNTLKGYLKKLKKRAYSLLLPYVIWVVLSGAFLTLLAQVPFFQGLDIVKEKAFAPTQFYYYFLSPASFPLWFVQQLMIFVILAPLIYVLVKYTRGIILVPLGALWAIDFCYIINFSGLFALSVGAAFAIFAKSRKFTWHDNRMLTVVFSLIWIGISLAHTFIAALGGKDTYITVIMYALYKLNEVIGVIAMWLIFDHIAKRITDKKGFIIAATHLFFVYAMHEPLLHLCFQTALKQGASIPAHIALFICLPISVGAVCIGVSMAFRKNFRKAHKLFTGGR